MRVLLFSLFSLFSYGLFFFNRRAEQERAQADRAGELVRLREAAAATEQQLRAQLAEASQRYETLEAQLRRVEWRSQDSLKEKQIQLEKYNKTNNTRKLFSSYAEYFRQSTASLPLPEDWCPS